ncbi:hypothetical protein PGT21_030272 [Puccinia graminis f. sp. tritici]|uniref:Uncharacterized protein n=1 Tax=Puccinia graminis f. sp. tritici TaxID=56615 RepID=A0A5B0RB41_PUCGR|nr:hypothetical protein PGT21_030272 [Puccinia graminis f. sp. tritici]KAA1122518.1 hypothetical protein PGTUg99_037732 [Puccinia graminis f. sp. tritici]
MLCSSGAFGHFARFTYVGFFDPTSGCRHGGSIYWIVLGLYPAIVTSTSLFPADYNICIPIQMIVTVSELSS